jgi:hypothetical protein
MDASALPTTKTASAINAVAFIPSSRNACPYGVSWWRPFWKKANAAVPSPAVASGVIAGAKKRAPIVTPRMNIPVDVATMTPFWRRFRLWRSNLLIKKFPVALVHVVLLDTALPLLNSDWD